MTGSVSPVVAYLLGGFVLAMFAIVGLHLVRRGKPLAGKVCLMVFILGVLGIVAKLIADALMGWDPSGLMSTVGNIDGWTVVLIAALLLLMATAWYLGVLKRVLFALAILLVAYGLVSALRDWEPRFGRDARQEISSEAENTLDYLDPFVINATDFVETAEGSGPALVYIDDRVYVGGFRTGDQLVFQIPEGVDKIAEIVIEYAFRGDEAIRLLAFTNDASQPCVFDLEPTGSYDAFERALCEPPEQMLDVDGGTQLIVQHAEGGTININSLTITPMAWSNPPAEEPNPEGSGESAGSGEGSAEGSGEPPVDQPVVNEPIVEEGSGETQSAFMIQCRPTGETNLNAVPQGVFVEFVVACTNERDDVDFVGPNNLTVEMRVLSENGATLATGERSYLAADGDYTWAAGETREVVVMAPAISELGSHNFHVFFATDSPTAHEQVMGAMSLAVVPNLLDELDEPSEAEPDPPQEREEEEAEEAPEPEREERPRRSERSNDRREQEVTIGERAAELRCSHERRDCSGCPDAVARRRCMTGE